MKKSLFDAIKPFLANIELIERYQDTLHSISCFLRKSRIPDSTVRKSGLDGIGEALAALHAAELSAYREVFMLALGLPPDQQEEIRKMAYQRFLSEQSSISHMLAHNGLDPLTWGKEEEKELREILEKEFAGDV